MTDSRVPTKESRVATGLFDATPTSGCSKPRRVWTGPLVGWQIETVGQVEPERRFFFESFQRENVVCLVDAEFQETDPVKISSCGFGESVRLPVVAMIDFNRHHFDDPLPVAVKPERGSLKEGFACGGESGIDRRKVRLVRSN